MRIGSKLAFGFIFVILCMWETVLFAVNTYSGIYQELELLRGDVVPCITIMAEIDRMSIEVGHEIMEHIIDSEEKDYEKLESVIKDLTKHGLTHIEIKVSDTGEGIPPDIRDRIFDPFFTTKEAGKGTGLGLSISYGIIQDHKGEIDVTDTGPEGTTFRIRLPIVDWRLLI